MDLGRQKGRKLIKGLCKTILRLLNIQLKTNTRPYKRIFRLVNIHLKTNIHAHYTQVIATNLKLARQAFDFGISIADVG